MWCATSAPASHGWSGPGWQPGSWEMVAGFLEDITENHWRTADVLRWQRLCLSPIVRGHVSKTFERWAWKGSARRCRRRADRAAVPGAAVNLADVVEVSHQAGGVEAAVAVARQRRGTQFDPALVDLVCDQADELFAELESVTSWEALMAAKKMLDRQLGERELDTACSRRSPTSST